MAARMRPVLFFANLSFSMDVRGRVSELARSGRQTLASNKFGQLIDASFYHFFQLLTEQQINTVSYTDPYTPNDV